MSTPSKEGRERLTTSLKYRRKVKDHKNGRESDTSLSIGIVAVGVVGAGLAFLTWWLSQ